METTFDKQGHIVIEKNDGNQENIYLIAMEDWFEKMPLSSTYGDYGQKASSHDAGDQLELLSERAVSIANGESEEDQNNGYEIGSFISAYGNQATFDLIIEDKLLKAGEDYELIQSEVLGYTFWDGHNWKTVTIETDDYEPTFKRLKDEKENEILKEFFEYDDYGRFGPGCEKAIGDQFVFYKSAWQGEWQVARVEYKYEDEEL